MKVWKVFSGWKCVSFCLKKNHPIDDGEFEKAQHVARSLGVDAKRTGQSMGVTSISSNYQT